MLTILKIVLSANFWIGVVIATLAVVGYLYSTLIWKRKKK